MAHVYFFFSSRRRNTRCALVTGVQTCSLPICATRPCEGDDHIPEGDPRGWQPIAPSAIPFGANLPRRPRAMTKEDIRRVQQDYVAAARRALAAGFDWLELHFAHGYQIGRAHV